MEAKSIDSLLIKAMQEQPVTPSTVEVGRPSDNGNDNSVDDVSDSTNDPSSESPPDVTGSYDDSSETEDNATEINASDDVHDYNKSSNNNDKNNDNNKDNKDNKSESTIDEYGNPISKGRLYTEEEVNQRIRDRLSRGRHAQEEQHQQQYNNQKQQHYDRQQVKQAQSEGFEHNPNSEESWEEQLGQFIDNRLEQKQRAAQEQQWQQQESAKYQEFTEKFSSGMDKYHDFRQVVQGKPITDVMMLATRGMDNPAAFIYGASKLHAKELDRIANIPDKFAQAAEVGRLHERMLKERKAVTQAPKPLVSPKGDLPGRVQANQPSLEKRIADYAKQKRK